MSAGKKKGTKAGKSQIERFAIPNPETCDLTDENYLFKCALRNEYQQFCGALDAPKETHPLAAFLIEKNLFNKRDSFNKSVFDLASLIGNKEFLKAILERTNEKEKLNDENVLNLREPLKSKQYTMNYMHNACVWNRFDVVKFLVEQDKIILDPDLSESDLNGTGQELHLSSISTASIQQNNKMNQNANMKTLGSILLKSKNKYGETPKDLAKRYNHADLIAYLSFAGLNELFFLIFKLFISKFRSLMRL
jgi:ankyrin repeat protein